MDISRDEFTSIYGDKVTVVDKNPIRAALEADVQAFIAGGGKITQVRMGAETDGSHQHPWYDSPTYKRYDLKS